ncbi:MAG TPA: 2-dehydropantoate 2-reductase N-terminal domain-containing protein [Baekduia sp.]|uniref:ketopantoate reductase family protein n=1 Tax=Baekduia sp. TaxID=2600305 RepID=UPI002D791639|nr:2-dehydropantoate 2-reductase N-terminal domain-containing protein [Baekduia sp.]HET6510414.1 2-dehydropantoate 2-reductase N-terminal domain-containing protein [Baekduia sp.]
MSGGVAILGSGAVGALIGAELTRAGTPIALVTTEVSVGAIAHDGVRVVSPAFGEHTERVHAVPALEAPPGVLLVATKAPRLERALERIAGEPEVVVPLLNGVDHMAVLRERFAHVVAGTVRVQAHREGRTTVIHRAPFLTVTIAAPVAALDGAPFEVVVADDEATVLWGKLTRLAALALATTAADAPLGAVRADAEAVAREVALVARAEGADVDADAIVEELRGLPDGASSSLRADVAAGASDHELDAIGGAVLRAAERHGLRADRTATLVARIGTL